MKKLYPLLFVLLVGMYSCQEVITVNLNSISAKLVVEGNVNNMPGPYTIKLSTTTNYFGPAGTNPLSGAKVVIADNAGNADTLHEATPGNYLTSTLKGTIGSTYYLTITSSGKTYTAWSTMPDTVQIDSVSYSLRPAGRPGSGSLPSYVVTLSFTDPPALGNNYGFRLFHNGVLLDDIVDNRVINDKFINGNAQHYRLRNSALLIGDSVQVDLVCFDKNAFDFYNTLKGTLTAGGPFSAPPSNPTTNITNGALGTFGAYAYRSRKFQLQ
jgi:hypothetical protein